MTRPSPRLVALTAAVLGVAIALAALPSLQAVKDLIQAVIDAIRAAGPLTFFIAMALLPALGFPLLPFVLAAGPAFAPNLGIGGVIGAAISAVTLNVTLTYLLGSRALHPLMQRILRWVGHDRLPRLPPGGDWEVVFLVRLMPGPPFWIQGYLLGLLKVGWLPYLVGSVTVPGLYIILSVTGTTALRSGQNRLALTALAALGIVAISIGLFRRYRRPPNRQLQPHD